MKIGSYKAPPSGTCIAKSSDEIDPASHCGNLNWACGPDNQWADVSAECSQESFILSHFGRGRLRLFEKFWVGSTRPSLEPIVKMNKSELHGNVVMSIQAHVPNMIWLKREILFTMHIINRWSSPDQIMAPVILVDLRKLFLIVLLYQV